MNNISELTTKALNLIKSNGPEILTALGVVGVATTSYLTGKASFAAAHKLEAEDPHMSTKDRAKLVWKLYIPAGVSGGVTVACIVGASKGSSKRTAAAVTAYSITERAFSEYKEKIVEQIGKGKEEKVRDELAQERVSKSPQGSVIITGKGEVLCCELYTRRFFRCDMETLRRAQNDVNALCISQMYASLEDFYDLIDLPYTSVSAHTGWEPDKLMELQFSTTLSENGEPCLAFDYNYTKPIR